MAPSSAITDGSMASSVLRMFASVFVVRRKRPDAERIALENSWSYVNYMFGRICVAFWVGNCGSERVGERYMRIGQAQ